MPHNYTIRDLKDSRKQIIITKISSALIQESEKKALKEASSQMKLKGFRTGKIPEDIVRKHVHGSFIKIRPLEIAVHNIANDIIHEKQYRILGKPSMEIESFDPLKITLEFDVPPSLELGDYHNISVKKETKKVTDKDVKQALENIRKRFAKYEGVDAKKKEVNEKILPEIDEAFIEKVSGKKQSLDEWKKSLSDKIQAAYDRQSQQKLEDDYYSKLIALSKVEIPKTMIETEKKSILNEIKQEILQRGISYDKYLDINGKTEAELLESFEDRARDRITLQMALQEIARSEKISVSDIDIENRVKLIVKSYPEDQKKKIEQYYEKGSHAYASLSYQIKMQKTLEKIIPKE